MEGLAGWYEQVASLRDGRAKRLLATVARLRSSTTVFPSQDLVFNALRLTPFRNVKVVILG